MGGVQLTDRLQDAQPRPHRPLAVVLVRRWRAEYRHDRVPDELLHCGAIAGELGAHTLVVGPHQRFDILRIGAVRPGGRADKITKQHRNDLALFAETGRGVQSVPAGTAEVLVTWPLVAAARASHACSCSLGVGPASGHAPALKGNYLDQKTATQEVDTHRSPLHISAVVASGPIDKDEDEPSTA